MNRHVRLTALLAVATVALLALYLIFARKTSTLDGADTAFAVQDTAAVQRIAMTHYHQDKEISRVVLTRQPHNWAVNERYRAEQSKIIGLLMTLNRLQVREPFHENAVANITRFIRQDHVRVEVETADGAEKTFFVGGETPVGDGNMMMMKGADAPYNVELPGFNGYLKPYFSAYDHEWREYLLFDITGDEAQSIELRYAGADSSFALKFSENRWALATGEPLDTMRVAAYLGLLGRLSAQGSAQSTHPGKLDSLRKAPPDARFSITPAAGKPVQLALYYRRDNINSYWGCLEGDDELLIIQKFNFERLLQRRDFFFARRKP